jgi:hypothetical protein
VSSCCWSFHLCCRVLTGLCSYTITNSNDQIYSITMDLDASYHGTVMLTIITCILSISILSLSGEHAITSVSAALLYFCFVAQGAVLPSFWPS